MCDPSDCKCLLTPNATQKHNIDIHYVRRLVLETGLTRQEVADTVGISTRQLYRILTGDTKMSYPIQHTLECLSTGKI